VKASTTTAKEVITKATSPDSVGPAQTTEGEQEFATTGKISFRIAGLNDLQWQNQIVSQSTEKLGISTPLDLTSTIFEPQHTTSTAESPTITTTTITTTTATTTTTSTTTSTTTATTPPVIHNLKI
jgi:hypothetical protein